MQQKLYLGKICKVSVLPNFGLQTGEVGNTVFGLQQLNFDIIKGKKSHVNRNWKINQDGGGGWRVEHVVWSLDFHSRLHNVLQYAWQEHRIVH